MRSGFFDLYGKWSLAARLPSDRESGAGLDKSCIITQIFGHLSIACLEAGTGKAVEVASH
jgi:hypothetical protein